MITDCCRTIKTIFDTCTCQCGGNDCESQICDPEMHKCAGVIDCENCKQPILRTHAIQIQDDLFMCVECGARCLDDMGNPHGDPVIGRY